MVSSRDSDSRVMKEHWERKAEGYVAAASRLTCNVRAVAEAFRKHGRIQPGQQVIELGCGHGRVSEGLASLVPEVHFVGVDLTQALLDSFVLGAGSSFSSVRLICADVVSLPLADEQFDVAVSARLFQYLPDPVQTLAEAKRVLRRGGRAVIAVPNRWNPILAMRQSNRLYSPSDIAGWLQKSGFRNIRATSCIFSWRAAQWKSWLSRLEILASVPGLRLLGGAAVAYGTK